MLGKGAITGKTAKKMKLASRVSNQTNRTFLHFLQLKTKYTESFNTKQVNDFLRLNQKRQCLTFLFVVSWSRISRVWHIRDPPPPPTATHSLFFLNILACYITFHNLIVGVIKSITRSKYKKSN